MYEVNQGKLKIIQLLMVVMMLLIFLLVSCTVEDIDMTKIYDDNEKLLTYDKASFKRRIKKITDNVYKINAKGFNGVYSLAEYEYPEQSCLFFELTIKAGRFKIIFTNKTEVQTIIDNSFSGRVDNLPGEGYTMKLVGFNADFELKITG